MAVRLSIVALFVIGLVAVGGCGDDDSAGADRAAERHEQRQEARERARAPRERQRERIQQELRQAKREARQAEAQAAAAAEPEPEPAPEPEPEPEPASDCEAGYDPCVPTYPPDLDCDDVTGPIAVTGSDPHGFDADGDGVGCE